MGRVDLEHQYLSPYGLPFLGYLRDVDWLISRNDALIVFKGESMVMFNVLLGHPAVKDSP